MCCRLSSSIGSWSVGWPCGRSCARVPLPSVEIRALREVGVVDGAARLDGLADHLGHKGAEARVQPQPCSALCVSTSTASAGKNSASSSGSATPGEVRVGALGRCCVPERAAATGAVALGRAKRDVFRGQHRLPFAACAISYGLLSEDLSAARGARTQRPGMDPPGKSVARCGARQ